MGLAAGSAVGVFRVIPRLRLGQHHLLDVGFHAGPLAGFRLTRRGIFRWGAAPLGIGGAEGDQSHADHGAHGDDPRLGPFPVQQVPDASAGVALAEGKGHPRHDAAAGGKAQQGGGVVRPDVLAQFPYHCLVAAHFHVLPRQNERRPHQRVEPVDAQGQKRQELHHMIPAAEVILLMPQDVASLRFRQGGGQVDLGPEQAHDEGGGDVVCQIDVVLQPHGPNQTAAEPQQRDHAVKKQQGHARQPRQGQDRHRAAKG